MKKRSAIYYNNIMPIHHIYLTSDLSTTAALGTEESGHWIKVAIMWG